MNYGVQKPIIKSTDWSSSGESGIKWKDNCSDWSSFLPTYEFQVGTYVATQACVTFSALNAIEIQLKQQTGKEFNFSDRFTAKMAGTTLKGAQMTDVLYSITHDGWLLEEDWPFDRSNEGKIDWDEYYKEIPQELKDKAKKNLEDADWEVKYEWVNMGQCNPSLISIKHELQQAPLQRASSFGSGLCATEHATVLYKIDDEFIYIFDSYDGGIVKNPLDYPMPWLMKIVVQPKSVLPNLIPPIMKDLYYGMKDNEVKYLQQKLIKLGYLSKGLDTGFYWNLTQLAVKKFQRDYKVASLPVLLWNNGKLVASLTRNKLNSL